MSVAVAIKRSYKWFVKEFKKRFGHDPDFQLFAEWCAKWGGSVVGDQCVFAAPVA